MAHISSIRDEIQINAPIDRCFLLSTSVEIVALDLKMLPVRGSTTGCLVAGDTVFWKGWKFGLPQSHESRIGPFEPPFFFRDSMIAGRFARFEHDHRFISGPGDVTLLQDEIRFTMPWGWVGTFVGRCIVVPHIRRLMRSRLARLKLLAEGSEWKKYLISD